MVDTPEQKKPVILTITNDETYRRLFDKLPVRQSDGYDFRHASAREGVFKDVPDALSLVAQLTKDCTRIDGILLHDNSLPLSFKNNESFQDIASAAIADESQFEANVRKKVAEQGLGFVIRATSNNPNDPVAQSQADSRAARIVEQATEARVKSQVAAQREAKEGAEGLLAKLVPSDASVKLIEQLRQRHALKDIPIVVIGSYSGREQEYRQAASGNIHIFNSDSINFAGDGIRKLFELVPGSASHADKVDRDKGNPPQL